jgi:hypothetical protein
MVRARQSGACNLHAFQRSPRLRYIRRSLGVLLSAEGMTRRQLREDWLSKTPQQREAIRQQLRSMTPEQRHDFRRQWLDQGRIMAPPQMGPRGR